jgi:hypothetical protein
MEQFAAFIAIVADPNALQRSKLLREPEEEGVTALGLRGEYSLVTITYLLTRRPQMSGSAGKVLTPRRQIPLYAPGCPFHNLIERSCACLLDHLIRLEEERRRDREAESMGGLKVDNQLEFYGLLHREVSWLDTLEDLVHVCGGATPHVETARTVRDQSTVFRQLTVPTHHREPALCREFDDLDAVGVKNRAGHQEDAAGRIVSNHCQSRFELSRTTHLDETRLQPQPACRDLRFLQSQRARGICGVGEKHDRPQRGNGFLK